MTSNMPGKDSSGGSLNHLTSIFLEEGGGKEFCSHSFLPSSQVTDNNTGAVLVSEKVMASTEQGENVESDSKVRTWPRLLTLLFIPKCFLNPKCFVYLTFVSL